MIEIKTDRGILRLSTWEDLESRPGFSQGIDPREVELKAVVGKYQFPENVFCGLRCRQPHKRGYLVQTADGRETNIGKDCGYTHLGVVFTEMSRQLDRDLEDQNRRETLEERQSRAPTLRQRLNELLEEVPNAQTVNRRARMLQDANSTVPNGVVEEVRTMIRNRSGAITVERETTEEEREVSRAGNQPVERYRVEQVGTLDGIEFLYQENDLRMLLHEDAKPTLDGLAEVDVDQLSRTELRDWAKKTEDLDRRIEQIGVVLAKGRRLLAPANLGQLAAVVTDPRERRPLEKFMGECASEGF